MTEQERDEAAAESYIDEPYVFMGTEEEKLVKAVRWGIAHERERVKELVEALETVMYDNRGKNFEAAIEALKRYRGEK